MKNPQNKFLLFTLAFLLFAANPLASLAQKKEKGTPQPVTLTAGETYTYRYLTVSENDMEMMGLQVSTENTIEKVFSYKVLEIDAEGTAKIRMRLERVENNMENNLQGKQEYNSERTGSKPHDLARYDAWLVGKEWTVFLDKYGKATELKGYDELYAEMIEEVKFKGEAGPQIKASLKDNYAGKVMLNQATEAFGSFPRRELKAGVAWKEKVSDDFVGTREFTVEQADEKELRYKMVRKVSPNKKAKATRNSSGVAVLNKMSGTQELTASYEPGTRILRKRTYTQKAEGDIEMSGGAMGNNPMDVPATQNTKNTIERITK